MASIFDQYHNTLKRETVSSDFADNVLPSSGYVSIPQKEEPPIFSKTKLDIPVFHDINQLLVSNSQIVIVLANNHIFRVNRDPPNKRDEISLENFIVGGLKIAKVFLDPLGAHLFVSVIPKPGAGGTPELIYVHRNSLRPVKLPRVKDEITAIAFNNLNESEYSTGTILLGTKKGLIFETDLQVDGEKVSQTNWKDVFDIGRNNVCPITGIEFYKIPQFKTYVIIVTTKNRLYKFEEIIDADERPPYLHNVFNAYLKIPEQLSDFEEITSSINYSKLKFAINRKSKIPRSFAWLTEKGTIYYELDTTLKTQAFIGKKEMINHPDLDELASSSKFIQKIPTSFVLTNFHALLLYPDHVTAVSVLNGETVYEEYFTEQFGKLLGIVKDSFRGAVYIYSSKFIFQYVIKTEHRNVWRMYAEKNEFESAKRYCIDNPAHMDIVLVKEANLQYELGEYVASALTYSLTQSSFEEVCLKFLELNENDALMLYLKNRLEKLDAQEKTQITMLVVWMVELYSTAIARCTDETKKRETIQEYDNFKKIPRVIDCMKNNRTVIYDLMASHGDNYNLTELTTVNRDFESVINQYINQNKFMDALNVLKGQKKSVLFYKYCPILMENIPKETIAVIMAPGKNFDVIKMLPTLVTIESETHVTEVIRYLEYTINIMGCIEQSVHNYLIKLYGKYKNENMMTYLEMQGTDATMVYYDIHYALRVCTEHKIHEACVFLQCRLEMWMPAVELALTFNTKLAQQTASQPSDKNLRRKLWLKIAEQQIKGKDDVSEAMDLIRECDLLKIEDILPFFSDFQKIDHFKEAICDALEKYNTNIQERRREMEDSAKSAERVREDLQSFRNRSITISATEQCSICEVYLLLKPFFVFPCGHKFHGDCLERNLMAAQTIDQNKILTSLKQKLAIIGSQATETSNNGTTVLKSGMTRDQIKTEIENILTSDCLYCGDFMINSLNQPFTDDWSNVNTGWD